VIAFVADENFNRHILNGLFRRNPRIRVIRVQDAGLTGIDDKALLEWASRQGCILLTHDVQTLVGFAWERVRSGMSMCGVIVVGRSVRISQAVAELLFIAECSEADEWKDVVAFLPL
jgi:hypothetical protein